VVSRSLSKPERETVISWSDDEGMAYIWTAQRTVITKLDGNPAAVKIANGFYGTTEWAEYRFPASLLTFRSRRPSQSAETRAKRTATLAAARAQRQ
jgi:hypothetical protein